MKLWDLVSGNLEATWEGESDDTDLGVLLDGRLAAFFDSVPLKVRNVASGHVEAPLTGHAVGGAVLACDDFEFDAFDVVPPTIDER